MDQVIETILLKNLNKAIDSMKICIVSATREDDNNITNSSVLVINDQ